jgi:hypothetical protein
MPCNGLHMLPNLKFLFCGVVFGLLLFAVTGAGVMLPDSPSRVGEMPEIGRPMIQQAIAEEPAPAQFYAMTLVRRSEELERLRERASPEGASASAPKGPNLPKPTVTPNPGADGAFAEDVEAPIARRDRASIMSGAVHGVQIAPAEARRDARPDDTDTAQIATSQRIFGHRNRGAFTSRLARVPIPPVRRSGRTLNIHRRAFHRKHRVAQAHYGTFV